MDRDVETDWPPPSSDPLQDFVCMVTVRLLDKFDAIEKREDEAWASQVNRLVGRSLAGLEDAPAPDRKLAASVLNAVVRDLEALYSSKLILRLLLTEQDELAEEHVAESLRLHVGELVDGKKKKKRTKKKKSAAKDAAGGTARGRVRANQKEPSV